MISKLWKSNTSMRNEINKPNVRQFNFTGDNNALTQNGRYKFAQKHALSIYSKNAIYSLIPKNGCTTLRTSIAAANGFFNHENPSEHINWIHSNTYTFSAQLRELITADYTFTVLRCPYARLVSLFLDKFLDKTPVAWTFYRLTNNQYSLDEINFFNFISKLKHQPHLLAGDIHWRKQTDFLIYQDYDDYFDFDGFELIKTTLKKKIGLDLIDARELTQHGREKHKKIDGDYSTTSASDLKTMKSQGDLPSLTSLLTPEIKQIIDSIYKDDFSLRSQKL